MTRKFLLPLIASLVALVPMAPNTARADVPLYLSNRGNDFLDLFRIRGGAAQNNKGFGAKARVTTVLQAGYVFFDGTYVGMDRRAIGVVDERRHEAGASLLYGSYNEQQAIMGNMFAKGESDWFKIHDRRLMRNLPHWDDGRRRPLSVGAELATPLIALDLGVYPEEAVDFVLGIFTIDAFRDDEHDTYTVPRPFGPPTADPLPDAAAPFASKRARFADEQEALAKSRLEAEGQGPAEGAAPQTRGVADGELLTNGEADDLMREVDAAPADEPAAAEPDSASTAPETEAPEAEAPAASEEPSTQP